MKNINCPFILNFDLLRSISLSYKNLNSYFYLSIYTMNSMVLGNYTRSKLPEVDLIRMHYVSQKKMMFLSSLILRQGDTLVVWFLSMCLCID